MADLPKAWDKMSTALKKKWWAAHGDGKPFPGKEGRSAAAAKRSPVKKGVKTSELSRGEKTASGKMSDVRRENMRRMKAAMAKGTAGVPQKTSGAGGSGMYNPSHLGDIKRAIKMGVGVRTGLAGHSNYDEVLPEKDKKKMKEEVEQVDEAKELPTKATYRYSGFLYKHGDEETKRYEFNIDGERGYPDHSKEELQQIIAQQNPHLEPHEAKAAAAVNHNKDYGRKVKVNHDGQEHHINVESEGGVLELRQIQPREINEAQPEPIPTHVAAAQRKFDLQAIKPKPRQAGTSPGPYGKPKIKEGITMDRINSILEAAKRKKAAPSRAEMLARQERIERSLKIGKISPEQAAAIEGSKYRKEEVEQVEEATGVTDYNPKSQGRTRAKLLQKFAKSGSPEHATAARKAGATPSELKAAMMKKEEVEQMDEGASHLRYTGTVGGQDYSMTIPRNGHLEDHMTAEKIKKHNPHLKPHHVTALVNATGEDEEHVHVKHGGKKYKVHVVNHQEPKMVYNEEVEQVDEGTVSHIKGPITHILPKDQLKSHEEWMESEGYATYTVPLPDNHPKAKTHIGIVSPKEDHIQGLYHEDGGADRIDQKSKKDKKKMKEEVEQDLEEAKFETRASWRTQTPEVISKNNKRIYDKMRGKDPEKAERFRLKYLVDRKKKAMAEEAEQIDEQKPVTHGDPLVTVHKREKGGRFMMTGHMHFSTARDIYPLTFIRAKHVHDAGVDKLVKTPDGTHAVALSKHHAKEVMKEEVEYIEEKLTAADPAGKWISDFVNSDNPRFEGKSKKKRMDMALGAYYAAQRSKNEEVVQEKLDPVGGEDKDIDNDGDHDKTDRYLHARRQAIGKAIAKKKGM